MVVCSELQSILSLFISFLLPSSLSTNPPGVQRKIVVVREGLTQTHWWLGIYHRKDICPNNGFILYHYPKCDRLMVEIDQPIEGL